MSLQEIDLSSDQNPDLIWDLDALQKRELAERFIRLFENRLCVYSESVSQLYTNYALHFPKELGRKMVVLPNPYAFHDTINHISPKAVRKTGLCVLPGEFHRMRGIMLARIGPKGELIQARPFKPALAQIISKLKTSGDVFLPVLVKGDLREFDQRMPYLHLHRLVLSDLPHLSGFELNDLRATVTKKLLMIYRNADQMATLPGEAAAKAASPAAAKAPAPASAQQKAQAQARAQQAQKKTAAATDPRAVALARQKAALAKMTPEQRKAYLQRLAAKKAAQQKAAAAG